MRHPDDTAGLPDAATMPQWRLDLAAATTAWPGVPPTVGDAIRARVEFAVFGHVPGPTEGDAPEVRRHPWVLCIEGATTLAGWGAARSEVLWPLLASWARQWGYRFDADGRYVPSVWAGGDWPRV